MGYRGAAIRPVVSVSPDWGKIFTEDTITLTCNVDYTSGGSHVYYYWYKNNRWMNKEGLRVTIPSAQSGDGGNYTCTLRGGDKSDPLKLEVSDDLVILQTPPTIYEDDSPTLRCHHREGYTALNTTFYKGSQIIKWSETDSELHLTHVNETASGSYSCSKVIKDTSLAQIYTDTAYIFVRELFSDPEIKVPPYPLSAGDDMTLTCETRLALLREDTKLQFAFYRNGQKVQEFGKSKKYRVKSAELYHSGAYTCDVRTSSGSVQKTSRPTNIRIKGAASRPVISMSPNWGKILIGESITLTCNTDATDQTNQRYYWYKDSQFIRGKGKTFSVTSAETRDSGYYRCQTRRGGLSDPIKLDVSSEVFILQAPPLVYEGDFLSIRCHCKEGYSTSYLTFYKDGQYIGSSDMDSDLQFRNIDLSAAGTYKCKSVDNREDSTYISVAELFTDPEIKFTSNTLILTCETRLALLRADTEMRYAFYRNGYSLYNGEEINTYSLKNPTRSNSWDYTCTAKSSTGSRLKTSRKVNIKIERADRPEISASPNTGKIFRGENITLTCNLDQYGRSIWFKGSQSMASHDKTIVILSADTEDSGDYQCKTSNSYQSDPFMLVVGDGAAVRPVISAAPNTRRIFTGDSVTLICNVDSMDEGYQAYYWYKGPDYIYISGKRFTVHAAELDDSGDYRCCTDNGDRSDPFTLDVSDVPASDARIDADREDLAMVAGDNVTFSCSVERGSSPSFLWHHNEQEVDDQSGLYQIRESGKTLYIESVSSHHGGTYQCRASNQISPGRTFTAESNVLTITVSEKIFGFQALLISVILLVLVLVLFILLFSHRHKLCLPFSKTRQTDEAFSNVQVGAARRPQRETNQPISNEEQSENTNLPGEDVREKDDVCYSYIDVHCRPQDSSSPGADKYSVSYSAVKCQSEAGDKVEDLNQGMSGSSSNIYENFSSM